MKWKLPDRGLLGFIHVKWARLGIVWGINTPNSYAVLGADWFGLSVLNLRVAK